MTAPEERDPPLLEEHREEIKLVPIIHLWTGCYKLVLHTSSKIGSEEWTGRGEWVSPSRCFPELSCLLAELSDRETGVLCLQCRPVLP